MPKTLPTLVEFLAALPSYRRDTMTTLPRPSAKTCRSSRRSSCAAWTRPLIAYGKYRYKSASEREGDWFVIGLTAGKTDYALHLCVGGEGGYLVDKNAAKLGKVKTGRSCINFKTLEDLNLSAAMAFVNQAG